MLKKCREAVFLLAVVTMSVFWTLALTGSFPSTPNKDASSQGSTEKANQGASPIRAVDPLAAFTAALVVVGILQAALIYFQFRDSRILQRAFISVEPGGIRPFENEDERIACDIVIRNAGNLPAQHVAWVIGTKLTSNQVQKEFPLRDAASIGGDIVVAPHITTRKGAKPITKKQFNETVVGSAEDR